MWKYAALLSYRGTAYCGWQKQKGSGQGLAPSIQATVDDALRKMTSEPDTKTVGSGRTDSGVHAMGQVVHFVLQKREWDPSIIVKGLNGNLPSDIQVQAACQVSLDFHSQRSALKKQYSYYFQQGSCAIPWVEPYSLLIKKKLDTEAMQKALNKLKGAHDFKPFQASGSKPGPTVREILEAEITESPLPFPGTTPLIENPQRLIRVRIVGTGFLKQMVRGIAGTLIQIGEGHRPPECVEDILKSQDRRQVGPTAAARALWLERVWYPKEFGLTWEN